MQNRRANLIHFSFAIVLAEPSGMELDDIGRMVCILISREAARLFSEASDTLLVIV